MNDENTINSNKENLDEIDIIKIGNKLIIRMDKKTYN